MPLNPGDILFTSNFTDADTGSGATEQFSFIATTDIAAGEVIRFHAPDTGFTGVSDAYFDFTVGAGGLSALYRVVITESSPNTMTVSHGNGSVSAITFTDAGNMPDWGIVGDDNIIASSNNEAIAGISNGGDWDQNLAATGLSRAAIDNAIANDDPSPVIDNITNSITRDNTAIFSGTNITDIDNPAFWTTTATDPDYTNPNIGGTTFATQDANIFCFAAGTKIATPDVEVSIETLNIGAEILTADGRSVPVKWIGRQTVHKLFSELHMQPVRICAGALGGGLPHSDLTVTADHGMIIDGLVINASALINGTTIDWVPMDELDDSFTVYHIETEAHDVILANGAPAETFVDYAGRQAFDNYAEYVALYGADRPIAENPAPRISSARMLPAALCARLGIRRAA